VQALRRQRLTIIEIYEYIDSNPKNHSLTEWYVLAWDAFKAPRFPVDEALKLARVVGLDFDQQVKNQICELKSSDIVLWDSKTRKAEGKLGPMGSTSMLDTLHQAAAIGRDQNTGAAKKAIEDNGLLEDATLLTALEALLNVLPAVPNPEKGPKLDANLAGAGSDLEALETLRRLAFADQVPEPARQMLLPIEAGGADGEDEQE
jgi:putative DNA methylase